jgi:hypothetical protein
MLLICQLPSVLVRGSQPFSSDPRHGLAIIVEIDDRAHHRALFVTPPLRDGLPY